MNTSEFDLLFDVKCPVCGSIPEFEITRFTGDGQIKTYKVISTCSHRELDDLILQRENEFLEKASEQVESERKKKV